MLAHEYQSYCSSLEKRGIIFSYSGYVSEGLLEALGETINRKMQIDETNTSTANRVFGVFVEQVQNVIRYSAERENDGRAIGVELSSGVVTIGRENGKFFVACGNLVLAADVPRLRDRLDQLQKMSKDELKAYYKEKLRQDPEAESKGASVGLIEIARKATEALIFDFLTVDADRAFFYLKVFV
jgi:hypothetical protein